MISKLVDMRGLLILALKVSSIQVKITTFWETIEHLMSELTVMGFYYRVHYNWLSSQWKLHNT